MNVIQPCSNFSRYLSKSFQMTYYQTFSYPSRKLFFGSGEATNLEAVNQS